MDPGERRVRPSTVITLAALIALVALLAWTSLSSSQVECEVCVIYRGRPNCARAAAPDRETAQKTAIDTACATISTGRAESLECSRLEPTRTMCR